MCRSVDLNYQRNCTGLFICQLFKRTGWSMACELSGVNRYFLPLFYVQMWMNAFKGFAELHNSVQTRWDPTDARAHLVLGKILGKFCHECQERVEEIKW